MRFIYTKAFAIFSACLVLLVILVFMQIKGWLDPVRATALQSPRLVAVAVKSVALPVKIFFTTIYNLRKITEENGRLANQVVALQQDLVQANQQTRENEALRKELGFVKNSAQPLQACTVFSTNPFGSVGGLVLNCGAEEGVNVGQAVVSQGHLVGKITYVGRHDSSVLLVTSSSFSTDARVSQTDQAGIVRGSFGSGLILDQVPQISDLKKGSLVVTAGINEKIPKNILVGEVSDILSTNNELFKKAALSSPVDFNNLEFVFVVK